MKEIKTVALVGLGAIGAYFADRLQPVLGDDLRVIAGGARAERIRREGLVINGKQEYYHVVEPGEGEPADLVIFATKMSGLQQAIEDVRAQIGPETLILSPLNGVESEEVVAKTYGWENIVYSLMRISSVKVGNTVSFDPNAAFYVEYGEKKNDPRTCLSACCVSRRCLTARASAIRSARICCWPSGRNLPATSARIRSLPCSTCRTARGAAARMPRRCASWLRQRSSRSHRRRASPSRRTMRATIWTSSRPFRRATSPPRCRIFWPGAKRRSISLPGAVIRLGKEYGVPTPYNEFLYHAIRVLEAKNAGTVEGI